MAVSNLVQDKLHLNLKWAPLHVNPGFYHNMMVFCLHKKKCFLQRHPTILSRKIVIVLAPLPEIRGRLPVARRFFLPDCWYRCMCMCPVNPRHTCHQAVRKTKTICSVNKLVQHRFGNQKPEGLHPTTFLLILAMKQYKRFSHLYCCIISTNNLIMSNFT